MKQEKIPGGYYIKARRIQESEISRQPPHVREIWDYLLMEANHSDKHYKGFFIKRGQLFRTYQEIRDALSWQVGWRKVTYDENQTKRAMKFLREALMIDSRKEPGGVLITILNYDFYQNPENYERTSERTSERTNDEPMTNQPPPLNNKNEKNGRMEEGKKEKVKKEKIEIGGEKPKKENEIHEEVISYLNEKAGKNFKSSTEATKKLINGRVSEGYSLEDFKRVIDVKTAKWKGHPKWDNFLRPQTLFRPSNFESYLNETVPPVNNRASRQGLLPSLDNVQDRHQNEAPRATTVHQALILQREETAERILQARAARRIKNEE